VQKIDAIKRIGPDGFSGLGQSDTTINGKKGLGGQKMEGTKKDWTEDCDAGRKARFHFQGGQREKPKQTSLHVPTD